MKNNRRLRRPAKQSLHRGEKNDPKPNKNSFRRVFRVVLRRGLQRPAAADNDTSTAAAAASTPTPSGGAERNAARTGSATASRFALGRSSARPHSLAGRPKRTPFRSADDHVARRSAFRKFVRYENPNSTGATSFTALSYGFENGGCFIGNVLLRFGRHV